MQCKSEGGSNCSTKVAGALSQVPQQFTYPTRDTVNSFCTEELERNSKRIIYSQKWLSAFIANSYFVRTFRTFLNWTTMSMCCAFPGLHFSGWSFEESWKDSGLDERNCNKVLLEYRLNFTWLMRFYLAFFFHWILFVRAWFERPPPLPPCTS